MVSPPCSISMYYIVDKVLQIRLTGPHRRHRIIYSTVCIKLSEGLGEAVAHPVWVQQPHGSIVPGLDHSLQ